MGVTPLSLSLSLSLSRSLSLSLCVYMRAPLGLITYINIIYTIVVDFLITYINIIYTIVVDLRHRLIVIPMNERTVFDQQEYACHSYL